MKFRNYCVIILGNTSDAISEIEKVSDSKINILDAKGVYIATFTSKVSPKEITNFFILNKRSFFVFDLNENNSGFNITRKPVHDGLFEFINEADLIEKNKESDTPIIKVKEINEDDINKMSINEKKEMFDKILDKGADKLTENDKKIIPFLIK